MRTVLYKMITVPDIWHLKLYSILIFNMVLAPQEQPFYKVINIKKLKMATVKYLKTGIII